MKLIGFIIRTVGTIAALSLCSCVTHATIHARKVVVTVSPTISPTVHAQGLPLSLP